MANFNFNFSYVTQDNVCAGMQFDCGIVADAPQYGGAFSLHAAQTTRGIKNLVLVSVTHIKAWVARYGQDCARKMLEFSIAHEIGHLANFDINPPVIKDGLIVDNRHEALADAFATKMLGLSMTEYKDLIDKLYKVCNKHLMEVGGVAAGAYLIGGGYLAQGINVYMRRKLMEENYSSALTSESFKPHCTRLAGLVLEAVAKEDAAKAS